MKKKYRVIRFRAGESIVSAMKELKSHKDLVCGSFNRHMLYSDESIDSAYKKITGKSMAEYEEDQRKWLEDLRREEEEHKAAIPELTKEWIEKGNNVLDEKYHELWAELVPVRLKCLYRGMELGSSLEIIELLNNGCKLNVAKKTMEGQGHSGMSFSLVSLMIRDLCDRGQKFFNYVKH